MRRPLRAAPRLPRDRCVVFSRQCSTSSLITIASQDLLTTKRLVLLETINALVRARPHAVLPQLSAGFWRALGR